MLNAAASNCSFRICSPRLTFPSVPAATRRDNLKRLLEDRFDGRIADLARAVDRDDAYIWQLLKGTRNIGERVARHIERALQLAPGSLDSATMSGHAPLTADELELLGRYRRATASWKLALRLLANLRGDVQDEVSSDVNILLAKVTADHAPDDRVAAAYGKPGALHEPGAPPYRKKHP